MRNDKKIVRALCTLSAFAGLGACGGATASLGEQPTLSGQIEAWDKGEGYTMQATVVSEMVGTAPIDAAGNFSITLAGREALAGHLVPVSASSVMGGGSPDCTGSVIFDPSPIFQGPLQLRVLKGTSMFTVNHATTPSPGSIGTTVSYIFVESDAKTVGSIDCNGTMLHATASYDLHYKGGWNRQLTVINAASQSTLDLRSYTGDAPVGAKWYAR